MDEPKGMSGRQDPSWILEQIEMGLRQVDTAPPRLPIVPSLSFGGIESAVTRTLQEELARLDELDENEGPGGPPPPGLERRGSSEF